MNQRLNKGLIFILGLSICACANETERQGASTLADASIDVSMADVVVDQDPVVDAGPALDMGSSVLEDQGMTFPAQTTGLTRHTIQHDGLERQYTIYIPESYVPTVRTPLLLNFHGNGGNVDAHLAASDFRSVADEAGVILVYPQGSVLDGESTHWNPLLPSPNNKSDADDFGFVAAMLDRLATELNVDDSRVYATGYSNGAGLVYGLACYLSERITAIAPVSGAMWVEMPGNCNATHPTSIAIFNGTEDFERPFDGFDGYLCPWMRPLNFGRDTMLSMLNQ